MKISVGFQLFQLTAGEEDHVYLCDLFKTFVNGTEITFNSTAPPAHIMHVFLMNTSVRAWLWICGGGLTLLIYRPVKSKDMKEWSVRGRNNEVCSLLDYFSR